MKSIIISIGIAAVLIGGVLILGNGGTQAQSVQNVSMENGTQVVEITAKGGYLPRISNAKADTPTIVRVNTKGTFDCSSALTIPSINYSKILPRSGVTDIEIPPQAPGTTLQGLCAMGMYNFSIRFN